MATGFLEAAPLRFARWATAVAPVLALIGCSSSAPGGDPWADDPFADADPPDVWADASYPDPSSDAGAVTWDSWVSGFSSVYCVGCHNPEAACGGSGCHTPDNPSINALLFDMREKSAWTDRLATIHCGIVAVQPAGWSCKVPAETYPKVFPGFPLPTNDARAIVADWLEAGCP